MRTRRFTRPAFTLVEMMVATALTLIVMLIIAQAFASATKTFSDLRTAGQLQEKTRGAGTVIRRDLTAEHFAGPYIAGRSGPRVGDQRLDQLGWVPPTAGYFEIGQWVQSTPEPIASWASGTPVFDGEGLTSTRVNGSAVPQFFSGHYIRFTVHLPNGAASELFCAGFPASYPNPVPPPPTLPLANDPRINSFPTGADMLFSQWAEVCYFLAPSPNDVTPQTTGPSLQLSSLRRRVRLLAPTGTNYPMDPGTAQQILTQYPDVAATYDQLNKILRVLGPEDVTNPANRVPVTPVLKPNPQTGGVYGGDDVLLTDVLSFEVKAAWFRNPTFNNLDFMPPNNPPPGVPVGLYGSSPASLPMFVATNPGTTVNSDAPYDDLPTSTLNPFPPYVAQAGPPPQPPLRAFDTWYRHPKADAIDWDRPQSFLTPSPFQPPLRINVRSLQIKLRVWDSRKETARQATIVEEI